MKQEATNTFGDGMIMDLNPLTTPNNVLTSALNATMITYNGNEFVLQNDMGNGRVETAYLPSGYVPVGIKEYGGIIYVASYNPLTNKGQIGSFPSQSVILVLKKLVLLNRILIFMNFSNLLQNPELPRAIKRYLYFLKSLILSFDRVINLCCNSIRKMV